MSEPMLVPSLMSTDKLLEYLPRRLWKLEQLYIGCAQTGHVMAELRMLQQVARELHTRGRLAASVKNQTMLFD